MSAAPGVRRRDRSEARRRAARTTGGKPTMTSGTLRPVGFVLQMELKRRQLGMGHGAWAAHLGIDRSLWYMLRHGQKELSIALIKRVLTLWREEFDPFVSEAVLAWRDRGPDGQERLGEAC